MNTERAQVGWGFWLWWVLASALGLTVGSAVGGVVLFILGFANTDLGGVVGETLLGAMLGAVLGASLGIPQWFVLRLALPRQVSEPDPWFLASAVGGVVGGAVGVAVAYAAGEVLGATLLGASLGIAQWLVLEVWWEVSRAGWWVLASSVGWAAGVGLALGEVAADGDAISELAVFFLGVGVGLAVYGAITGGVLVWLLRQPSRKA